MAEHGVVDATYVSDGARYWPTLRCSCGHEAQGRRWEAAGAQMDLHLTEMELEVIQST